MKRVPRRCSTPFTLSASLHRQLSSYALAASAAGVSLLALAQPSEAKIVYTKIHQVIGPNGIYAIDLNHDGTFDFLVQRLGGSTGYGESGYSGLFAKPALGNSVQGSHVVATSGRTPYLAFALHRGARIGQGQGFVSSRRDGPIMLSFWASRGGGGGTSGQWKNAANRYLGLKFKIDGKTHYGWARMSVEVINYKISSTLTGYAYETIPGKPIRAGEIGSQADDFTTGPTANLDSSVPRMPASEVAPETAQPASLGKLALGAQSVQARRQP